MYIYGQADEMLSDAYGGDEHGVSGSGVNGRICVYVQVKIQVKIQVRMESVP